MSGADDMQALSHDLTRVGVTGVVRAGTVLRKAVTDIQGRAQTLAPVDTGNLRGSITSEVGRDGAAIRGEVGPTANYGRYVEEGTSRQRPQPYLRPATDAVLPSYDAALEQITDGLL